MASITHPLRILVIDDDDALRSVLRQLLEMEGYSVALACHGNEGLGLASERPFDLVITDLLMPVKEGIETIREISRRWPRTKIIAMSGGGVGQGGVYLDLAMKLGAGRMLAKPFDFPELLNTVKELTAI
jgi:DNA-binding response OmpR family regulator